MNNYDKLHELIKARRTYEDALEGLLVEITAKNPDNYTAFKAPIQDVDHRGRPVKILGYQRPLSVMIINEEQVQYVSAFVSLSALTREAVVLAAIKALNP